MKFEGNLPFIYENKKEAPHGTIHLSNKGVHFLMPQQKLIIVPAIVHFENKISMTTTL